MNQPTKEQIQWFWEQCGLKILGVSPAGEPKGSLWGEIDMTGFAVYPNEIRARPTPELDLNNLFKYAVPKGSCVSFIETGCDITNCILTTPELKITQGRGKSEALALFWAIYKAFGGEK